METQQIDYDMNIVDAVTGGKNELGNYRKVKDAIATLKGNNGKGAQTELLQQLAEVDGFNFRAFEDEELQERALTSERTRLIEILEATADIMPESPPKPPAQPDKLSASQEGHR